jgi:hypothetical protein
MTFLSRLRSLLSHDDEADACSARVDDAFARVGTAQRRAGNAATEVRHAAESQAKQLRSVRVEIQERVQQQKTQAHAGETSDVRHLVEDLLRSMSVEPSKGDRDPC